MKTRVIHLLVFTILLTSVLFCQTEKFRNGIFLHHSTGGNIWGPNGSSTSIPDEVTRFNNERALTGDNAFSLEENWYPGGDNEWYTWDRIFNNDPSYDDIHSLLANNKIVIIKSCFPSSNIYEWGSWADTLSPDYKTVYNYKWHWRNIINVMKKFPQNFFAIWTNAPLLASDTNDEEAMRSDAFCQWAKDTLALGLNEIFGAFPPNVYVFDFFHKISGSNGKLKAMYSAGDSHPNGDATQLVAPQFVDEILGAALLYENFTTDVDEIIESPNEFNLEQNYPNPFNPETVISWQLATSRKVQLKIYDLLGREIVTLVDGFQSAGIHHSTFSTLDYGLPSGVYFYKLQAGEFSAIRKMILLK
ncbi:MAG: T9SS type A sorting domain-containing protein [bacterium]